LDNELFVAHHSCRASAENLQGQVIHFRLARQHKLNVSAFITYTDSET